MGVIMGFMQVVRFILFITQPLSDWVLDFFYRLYFGADAVLPPFDDKTLLMSATELAEKIRKKQLKAVDVMKSCIKRIKEVEPLLNACVDQRYEAALKEAAEVDEFLAKTPKSAAELQKQLPLLGVPFSCKEIFGIKGLAQTCGIYSVRDRKAEEDGDAPSLYRKAGAIPVVVTNCPEFCFWHETANLVFGQTKNPYNNIRSVGGSSGGESVVICYGGAVIGIGNDLIGSIRLPCSFEGIYGYRGSPGMISNRGIYPPEDEIDHLSASGPMCRYVQDLPLLASVLSEGRVKVNKPVDFRKIKVYYMEKFPGLMLKPTSDIRAAVRKAAKYFEDTYQTAATKLHIPELQYAWEIAESKLIELGKPPLREALEPGKNINLFTEFIKVLFRMSNHTLPAVFYAAIEKQEKGAEYQKYLLMFESLKQQMYEVLKGGAILLVPTYPEPPFQYMTSIAKLPCLGYTCIFSFLSLPAAQIPAGMSNGLPIGIQAISMTNDDHLTIAAAVELDKLFGGWKSPCKIAV